MKTLLTTINQDYRFHYVLIGNRAPRPSRVERCKPVILFLHGFMGDCNDFSAVVDYLSDFCCLMVDLPGHGRTEVSKDNNYLMPQLAEALIALLEQLNIQQCYLVGYSMGGRLALYLAVFFSQYFSGVVLESASPGLNTQSERDRRIIHDLSLARQLESGTLTQFIRKWYANPLFESFIQHPNYHQVIAQRLRNNPLKIAKSLRYMGLGMQPSLWNNLAEVQIPLRLVVGELDAKFVAINQQIDDLCPLAQLKIVKNSGHNVHFEHPIELSNSIKYL